jgi:hypothetical protein
MAGYLWAILVPPVPMFQQGRVVAGIVTLVLMVTIAGWPIAALIAVLATRNQHIADKRHADLVHHG